MKTNIKTVNIELTDVISDYVDKKLQQVDRLIETNDDSVLCEVEIGTSTRHHQSGKIFRAEINLRVSGKNFRTVSEKEDLYVAINEAKEDIIGALKSGKTKQRTRVRRGAGIIKNIIKGLGKSE